MDGVQYAATAPMQLDTEYVIAPTSEPETASVNVKEDCAEEICEVLYVTPVTPGTLPETVIAELEPVIEAIIGIQVHDEEMAPTFGVKRPPPMP